MATGEKCVYDARDKDCVRLFCNPREEGRVEFKNSLALAFQDKYPMTQGHMLVSPLRHAPSFFLNWVLQNRTESPCFFAVIESKGEERSYAYRLAAVMGFNNVGINDSGSDAGQMIMHCPTFII